MSLKFCKDCRYYTPSPQTKDDQAECGAPQNWETLSKDVYNLVSGELLEKTRPKFWYAESARTNYSSTYSCGVNATWFEPMNKGEEKCTGAQQNEKPLKKALLPAWVQVGMGFYVVLWLICLLLAGMGVFSK